MSTFKIDRRRQDGRTLLLSSRKTFSSSSSGVTGSVTLGSRVSKSLRDLGDYATSTQYRDTYTSTALRDILVSLSSSRQTTTDVSEIANSYLNSARGLTREDQRGTVVFSPSVYSFDPAAGDDVLESEYSIKKYARRTLSGSIVPYYAVENQGKHFAVGNYFSLNFFTASCVPSNTAIIFPDFATSGTYRVSTGVTLDLHLNPRYTTDGVDSHFPAGTIAHLPGNYSLSLVTGSSRGPDGRPDKFRLVLGLTQSADVNPASVDLTIANGARTGDQQFIYVSDDNAIAKNTWNHISVGWSSQVDNGRGRFTINGEERGFFFAPVSSIARSTPPGGLLIGNHATSSNSVGRYFNQAAASAEGIASNASFAAGDPGISLASPLNAEMHSLKIYSRVISETERLHNEEEDASLPEIGLIFYLPPVFMHESPLRDVPVTMFDKTQLSTAHPLNVDLMFGCGGRDTNVENFARDLTRFGSIESYPRLFNLTASLDSSYADSERNFNTIYYRKGVNRKRNLTVLPCDDGQFRMSYASLSSISGIDTTLFRSYGGALDYAQVSLTGMVEPVLATSPVPVGQTRQDPGGQRQQKDQGAYYQVQYEDQEDFLIFGTLIDVSTIHYGHRIKGGSFEVTDSDVSGSCGRVSLKYRDDARNGLYRADCLTAHAEWNTQGLMFTNEGMGIILSPTVPFFGKDRWEMGFDTDASVHVLTMDVVVPDNSANISQNPTYRSFPPTTGSDDVGTNFVYIDTINVHDENLNVVARATLSQPILKRPEDEMLFRLKLDF